MMTVGEMDPIIRNQIGTIREIALGEWNSTGCACSICAML